MSIRLTLRNDCHVHDKAPQSRVDNYLDTCISKLRCVAAHAKRTDSHAVIDGGDFFHAKAATKNSHEMVRRVIDLQLEEKDDEIHDILVEAGECPTCGTEQM